MILKGNQRGGGRQMALHLLNGMQNEHVNVHEVRGFIAEDVLGALNEAYALSKGTKCTQFMYSLSLNPPKDAKVGIGSFEEALEKIEKKLKLEGQPRVVVFHEKNGRRHAHCVWSRINVETMTAVNMDYDHDKLNGISKSLFLDHNWELPEGFLDKSRKNPLNFTRAEWEQAKRIGRKAPDIKREIQECWSASDSKKTFENALEERGYYLARGDRRGFVAVDIYGEIYALPRQLGRKTKELNARLGDPSSLKSVDQVKDAIAGKITKLFKTYSDELTTSHKQQFKPLVTEKEKLVKNHRAQRAELEHLQQKHWQEEELQRSKRIRKGFKGVWDKVNGRYWKTRKVNEKDAWQCHLRDQTQKEDLIQTQLSERAGLQKRIDVLHQTQEQERSALIKDLKHVSKYNEKSSERIKTRQKQKEKERQSDLGFDDPDFDIEPEL